MSLYSALWVGNDPCQGGIGLGHAYLQTVRNGRSRGDGGAPATRANIDGRGRGARLISGSVDAGPGHGGALGCQDPPRASK